MSVGDRLLKAVKRTCRKERLCCRCKKPIKKGEEYWQETWALDKIWKEDCHILCDGAEMSAEEAREDYIQVMNDPDYETG